MNEAIRMQLSAFVDGELPENEAEMLLRRMSQDVELRQEVAEYLALSRVVRGELGVAGADRLYERVSAEIDAEIDLDMDYSTASETDYGDTVATTRSVKPLLGFALAATVALLAIFGLQRSNIVDEPVLEPPVPIVAVPEVDTQLELRRQYFLNHANESSRLGANGINSRLVTLRFSEEVAHESMDESKDKSDVIVEADTEDEDRTDINETENLEEAVTRPK